MSETLMTDTATTTEGAPTSTADATAQTSTAATTAADTTQAAAPANQQQAADGTTSTDTTNAASTEEPKATQDDKPAEKQGAPEKYEFKAPENVNLDKNTMAEFSEVAKELNMPQEAAQKILDKMAPAMAQRQAEAIGQLHQQWTDTTKSDKEIGGDKLTENLGVAKKALDAFGTPELRTLLEQSGLGNHPEIIRAFYRAGKSISEDRMVSGGTGGQSSGNKDYSRSLYPNQQT